MCRQRWTVRLGEVEPVFGQTGRVVLDITARTAHDGALKWTRPSTPRAARSILATFPSTCALPSGGRWSLRRVLQRPGRQRKWSSAKSSCGPSRTSSSAPSSPPCCNARCARPRLATRRAPSCATCPGGCGATAWRPSTFAPPGARRCRSRRRTTARNTPVGRSGGRDSTPPWWCWASTTGARRSWPRMQAARSPCSARWPKRRRSSAPRVRLFFVEKFLPYSWAFLPADASLQCSFRGDSNQASAYPRLSGGQPSLETVPNTVGLSPSGALPSGHSRGVLVRFHGQGDRPVMAVTTGFQGRRFDVPEARTGVPRIDLPSPAPCAAADAVFADAKAFLSSNEARQMSESELERELHRRGQELVRKLLQGHRDQRSPKEAAGPAEDTSGVECSEPHEHESHAETTSGTMQVVGLGCARRGHDGLHRLDAALNRLPERYLVEMRRRVTIATASRAPPRTPWKPQWYSTLSTWQRRCGVRCSSPAH